MANEQTQNWFREKVIEAATAPALISSASNNAVSSIVPGSMYLFVYDPKYKATLPKYDMFPLVFVLEGYPDGFLGLNLHYLTIRERSALIDELLDYANNNSMDDSTKLLISYKRLKAASMVFELAKPCVKRYLFTHCRSRFIEVHPQEWDKAAQLRVDDFVYAT